MVTNTTARTKFFQSEGLEKRVMDFLGPKDLPKYKVVNRKTSESVDTHPPYQNAKSVVEKLIDRSEELKDMSAQDGYNALIRGRLKGDAPISSQNLYKIIYMQRNNILVAVHNGRLISPTNVKKIFENSGDEHGKENIINLFSKLFLSNEKQAPLQENDIKEFLEEQSLTARETEWALEDHHLLSDDEKGYVSPDFIMKASILLSNRTIDPDLVDTMIDHEHAPTKKSLEALAALSGRKEHEDYKTEEQKKEVFEKIKSIILKAWKVPDKNSLKILTEMFCLQDRIPLDIEDQALLVPALSRDKNGDIVRDILLEKTVFEAGA